MMPLRCGRLRALMAVGLPLLLTGCGFVEAATEQTVGEGRLDRVKFDLKWPGIDELMGDKVSTGDGQPNELPGLPTSYAASTLAHLQGLMVLTGECKGVVKRSEVQATSGKLKELRIEAINCGSPDRCRDDCGAFIGMQLRTRYQMQLVDDETAAEVAELLTGTSPGAITQIRLRFHEIAFRQPVQGKDTDVTPLFKNYVLGLATPGKSNDSIVVQGSVVLDIAPATPRRFEIDPAAEVTRDIREAIVTGKPLWVEVFQRLSVVQSDLYSVALQGGGVQFDFQPEVVLSVLDIAEDKL